MREHRKAFASAVLVLSFVEVVMSGVTFADATWTITQLTNNSTDDKQPAISGTNVVWEAYDADGQSEIYSNFGGQLSSDSYHYNYRPAISGTNVVWQGWGGSGSNWAVYSNFAGQLDRDDDYASDGAPDISGTNVVWMHGDGYALYSNFGWQLTDSLFKRLPTISGTNVAWQAGGWQTPDTTIYGIFSNFAGQLSSSSFDDYPDISGTNVVWHGSDGIASNFGFQTNGSHAFPAISGTNVVWESLDSVSIDTNFGGRVFTDLFGLGGLSPDISGTNIVWSAWDGSDYEIYMATYNPNVVPAPASVLLGILGLGTARWKLRKCA